MSMDIYFEWPLMKFLNEWTEGMAYVTGCTTHTMEARHSGRWRFPLKQFLLGHELPWCMVSIQTEVVVFFFRATKQNELFENSWENRNSVVITKLRRELYQDVSTFRVESTRACAATQKLLWQRTNSVFRYARMRAHRICVLFFLYGHCKRPCTNGYCSMRRDQVECCGEIPSFYLFYFIFCHNLPYSRTGLLKFLKSGWPRPHLD